MDYEKAHRELWGWLARYGSRHKGNWPGWEWNGGEYEEAPMLCFACEACVERCRQCPITWTDHDDDSLLPCMSEFSPYAAWTECTTTSDRRYYAKIIRDLPWKIKEVADGPSD